MQRRSRRHPRISQIFSSGNRSRYEERTYYNDEYREHNAFKTVIIIAVIIIVLGAIFVIGKYALTGSDNKSQEATKPVPSLTTPSPAPEATDDVFSSDETSSDNTGENTPAPENTPSQVFAGLKYHDDNEEVKAMQDRLVELGYLHVSETTTYYGNGTRIAVSAFQRQHSLTMTGDADEETLEILYSDDALEYELKDGDEGEDVKALQEILVKLKYIKSSDATGHYGSVTRHAIRDFQDRNDLEKTGVADKATIDLLYEINNKRK